MPELANSVTHTPPPPAASGAPYPIGSGLRVTQPWLSFAFESQFVASTILLVWFAPTCVQPGSVWRPICADVTLFTPSNVSISPPCGHTCADDQNAGQTEHLAGRGAARSAAGVGADACARRTRTGCGSCRRPRRSRRCSGPWS
jgi:hypothetical protein